MKRGKENTASLLLPQEVALYCGGGEKYGPQALAQRVVDGDIPSENVRKIVGVDQNGNPIYEERQRRESGLPRCNFVGPNGERHRQPPRARR